MPDSSESEWHWQGEAKVGRDLGAWVHLQALAAKPRAAAVLARWKSPTNLEFTSHTHGGKKSERAGDEREQERPFGLHVGHATSNHSTTQYAALRSLWQAGARQGGRGVAWRGVAWRDVAGWMDGDGLGQRHVDRATAKGERARGLRLPAFLLFRLGRCPATTYDAPPRADDRPSNSKLDLCTM